ncbi:MAG: ester cyclase [Loktanella sp.]|nr:ester cyclase [Loktanella sp.]
MNMSHEEQAEATRQVIQRMERALGDNSNDMAAHFHEDFHWYGNQGCGTKDGLAAFRANWQLPLRAAFTDRTYHTQRFVCEGNWASCFGHIEGTHSGTFMGIPATGQRVTIPYMDFWQVEDGRIKDNWVSVDFASVLAQLGRDVFDGEGWESYDNGDRTPSHPEEVKL